MSVAFLDECVCVYGWSMFFMALWFPRGHSGSRGALPTDHHHHHHPHYHNLFLTKPAWQLSTQGPCHLPAGVCGPPARPPPALCTRCLWITGWTVFSNTDRRTLNLFSSVVFSSLFRITMKCYFILSLYFFMIKVFVQQYYKCQPF